MPKRNKITVILVIIMIFTMTFTGLTGVYGTENPLPENPDSSAEYISSEQASEAISEEIISSEESSTIEEISEETSGETTTGSSEQTSEEQTSEETSEEIPEIVINPTINNFTLKDGGFGVIDVTWTSSDCDKVEITYSSNKDFSSAKVKQFNANDGKCQLSVADCWKSSYVKLTPINDKIRGESKEKSINIWDNYLPGNVEAKNTVFSYNSSRVPTVRIKNKKGAYISEDNYTVVAAPAKVGKSNAKIQFKNKYKGIKEINVPCIVNPPAPTSFSVSTVKKDLVNFYVTVSEKNNTYDYCEATYANNKDFKNAKTIKLNPKKSSSTKRTISKLKKNTTYYIRLRYVKTVDGKKYKSEPLIEKFRTAGSAPSTSLSNKTTKSFVKSLKGNKSFYINFPQLVPVQEAFNYIDAVVGPRPQYDKFDIHYCFKNGVVEKVKMVYKSGKAKKAAKVKTKINSIVKKAKKIKGTKAKVKYVNKRLCQMCSYDWAAYRYNGNSSKYDDAYEAYGCLVKGKAVCSGYAEAFSAIMTELNIPVKYVSTSDHIWNKVKVGKEWLHVDVTWNDCTSSTRWLLKTTHKD